MLSLCHLYGLISHVCHLFHKSLCQHETTVNSILECLFTSYWMHMIRLRMSSTKVSDNFTVWASVALCMSFVVQVQRHLTKTKLQPVVVYASAAFTGVSFLISMGTVHIRHHTDLSWRLSLVLAVLHAWLLHPFHP